MVLERRRVDDGAETTWRRFRDDFMTTLRREQRAYRRLNPVVKWSPLRLYVVLFCSELRRDTDACKTRFRRGRARSEKNDAAIANSTDELRSSDLSFGCWWAKPLGQSVFGATVQTGRVSFYHRALDLAQVTKQLSDGITSALPIAICEVTSTEHAD